MFYLRIIISLCTFAILKLLCPDEVLAWGPGVHTITALNTLGHATLILPSIAKIITSYPRQYLYGCLAADFFIGKGKKKNSGHPHNWEGGFRFLNEASDDRESAFAYGFLSHLAADVVAHNLFIPNLTDTYPTGRKMGHLYWEVKADYLIGPDYTKIARDVLKMDHKGCDDLLHSIAGEKGHGVKVKKRLYARSIRLSDYFHTTHNFLSTGKTIRGDVFHKHLAFMVDLSCRMVEDFLTNPQSSKCLLYNPMGRQDLGFVKQRRTLKRFIDTHLRNKRVAENHKLFMP